MNENLPIVERFLSYLIDERAFSPYTSRCYGLDLRQFVEFLEGDLKIRLDMKLEQSALDAATAKKPIPTSISASILSCDVERIRGFLAKLSEQNYSPATMARRIFWPLSPTTSDRTLVSWMFIWVRAFCMCCTKRPWLRSSMVRWRLSERSSQT